MVKRNVKSSAPKSKKKFLNKQKNKTAHKQLKKNAKGKDRGLKKDPNEVISLRDNVFVPKRRRTNRDDDDDESLDELYEKQPRKLKKSIPKSDSIDDVELNYQLRSLSIKKKKMFADAAKNSRLQLSLPIKTKEGLVVKNKRVLEEVDENETTETGGNEAQNGVENLENGNGAVDHAEAVDESPKSFIELIRDKKEFMEKAKEKIATLSRNIIENPQEQTKKLKELRTMLSQPEIRSSNILKKLIMVSLCEIFKDICPSYKIRPWSSKENEQAVSKDVKQLKEYEETLLKQYKLYIDYLQETIRGSVKLALLNEAEKRDAYVNLAFITLRCVTQLFEKLFYFNFSNDLIDIVVGNLTAKFTQLADLAAQSIRDAFKADKTLHLSLEIAQKIGKLCRQRSFGIKPDVLNVFLSLKLTQINVPDDEDKAKRLKHKDKLKLLSRSERKKLKEKERLEHDLEEKKITDRLKEKANIQARILEQIFAIYIKILKKTPNLKLIPCVLEGLSKFAHLINLDFFEDLLKLLHEMIESDNLSFRSKLHCIKTVFVVLSGQGEALTIDPVKFYTSLYNVILKLSATQDLEDLRLLADCVEMMFIKRRRHVPSARFISFIKRLGILSVHLDGDGAVIILELLSKLYPLNKSSDLLFDNEYQDSGIYNPELTEPDYTNAQNSALWELHTLRRHYCNHVKESANDFIQQSLK